MFLLSVSPNSTIPRAPTEFFASMISVCNAEYSYIGWINQR